jgi:hypothetical protein
MTADAHWAPQTIDHSGDSSITRMGEAADQGPNERRQLIVEKPEFRARAGARKVDQQAQSHRSEPSPAVAAGGRFVVIGWDGLENVIRR